MFSNHRRFAVLVSIANYTAALAWLIPIQPAVSATHDEIVESCRQSVGRPIVQSCLGGQRGDSAALEACRAKASPQVRACVIKEEQRIAGGKAAPAAPKAETATQGDASLAPTAFVAPPRTIADVTSILEQEKPDAARIEKAKAAADLAPPQGDDTKKLAQFYYDAATRAVSSPAISTRLPTARRRSRSGRARSTSSRSRA